MGAHVRSGALRQLIALAEDHETKARAIRLTIAEWDGSLTARKAATADSVIAAAVKVRATQRPAPADLAAALRAILGDGHRHLSRAICAELAARGIEFHRTTIARELRAIGAKLHGRTSRAAWSLPPGKRERA